MTPPPARTGLARLLVAQTQVVFTDNVAKLGLIGLAYLVLPPAQVGPATGLLAALLVLPFVLFSPLFGWMADRFSKTRVLAGGLVFQCAAAAALAGALALPRFDLAVVSFFLLSLQASAFSPAKQGILKELVGEARLNQAVSWMEALTVIAILLGGVAGGFLLDALARWTGNPWHGGALLALLLAAGCGLSWLVFRGVPVLPARAREPFRAAVFWEHFRDLRRLAAQPALFGAAAGIAWFYGLGGLLYLVLVQVGRLTHPEAAASRAGLFLALLGGGIIGGSLLYASLSKDRISLRTLPFSAGAMTTALGLLALLPLGGPAFLADLVAVGLCGGTFVIPVNAYLQDKALDAERGRMIGASNLLTNLTGILAVGVQYLLAEKARLAPAGQFACIALSGLAVTGIALAGAAGKKAPR